MRVIEREKQKINATMVVVVVVIMMMISERILNYLPTSRPCLRRRRWGVCGPPREARPRAVGRCTRGSRPPVALLASRPATGAADAEGCGTALGPGSWHCPLSAAQPSQSRQPADRITLKRSNKEYVLEPNGDQQRVERERRGRTAAWPLTTGVWAGAPVGFH